MRGRDAEPSDALDGSHIFRRPSTTAEGFRRSGIVPTPCRRKDIRYHPNAVAAPSGGARPDLEGGAVRRRARLDRRAGAERSAGKDAVMA